MLKRMLWVTFGFFIGLAIMGVYLRQFNPDALFYFFLGEISWEFLRSRSSPATKTCSPTLERSVCGCTGTCTETAGPSNKES